MAFTIKELESLSGIKAHTIRIWEQRYNFLKPDRTATNIRTYNNEELKTLLSVALLNKYGYKISRIDDMNADQRSQAILGLSVDEAQNEYLINRLIGCMVDLKNLEFEQIINDYIQENGLQQALNTVIFQFLEKVGILWQANRINPAHEHVVSNIVRQKIISAIDALPVATKATPPVLLFLPEYEHHELGLLFVHYLLKKQSLPVLYLGANVPVKDVQYVVQIKKPSHLYTHLTSFPRQLHFEKLLSQLSAQNPLATLLVSGSITSSYSKSVPKNVMFLKSLDSVFSYVSNL